MAEMTDRSGPRILVADDEDLVLDLTRRILERAGYEVVTATDGAAALDLFRQQSDQIDLVFLDVTMPKMTGQQAVGEILKLKPDARIILSTGFDAEQLRSEMQLGDRISVVQKPFNAHDLVHLVQDTLNA